MTGLQAHYRPLPFLGAVQHYDIVAGQSLAEIAAAVPDLPDGFDRLGVICINGEPIPREWWRRVRPRPEAAGTCIVTLHAPLQDNKTLRTVASIAVLIGAALVSGGALGPLGSFAIGGATITGASVAGTAVAVGGMLAVNALIPPPSTTTLPGAVTPDSFNQGAASLSGNVLAKGRPFPRVIGTRKVYPMLVAEPFVFMRDDDSYVEAVYGLAGPHKLEDIRIDGVELASLDEIEIETREGWPTDTPLTLVTRQAVTRSIALEVSRHIINPNGATAALSDQTTPANSLPVWQTVSTRDSPDEFRINLHFVEGLSYDLNAAQIGVPVRLRMRQRGSATWINLPEIHFVSKKIGAFQRSVRLRFGASVPSPLPTPVTYDDNGAWLAYKVVPSQTTTPASGGWTAHSIFSIGSGDDVYSSATAATTKVTNVALYSDRVDIFLPSGTFPQGFWDIQIMEGMAYSAPNFVWSNYSYTVALGNFVYDFFGYATISGVHRLVSDVAHARYRIIVDKVQNLWQEHPCPTTDLALIAITAKNRSVGQLSVLASGYTNDWNGSAFATTATTSNPAPHVYEMLTGTLLNKNPLPTAIVDSAAFVTWRSHCIAQGLACNAVLEGKSVFEAGTVVAAAGMARMRQSEIWDVLIDKDVSADAPVQIFTPRNSSGFRFEKSFADLPNGLLVKIEDAADDYAEIEFQVDDPLGTPGTVYEATTYDVLTSVALATARAELDLKQTRLRMTFYSLTVAAEHLLSRRGDLVGVQHDVLVQMAGFARIKSVVRSGGFITSITLDGTIKTKTDTYTPAAIGISVQLTNGTVWTKATTVSPSAGEVTVITFGGGVASDPGSTLLTEGCLVATGETGATYSRMKVYSVAPKDEFTAEVVLVDEAPSLF